MDNTSIPGGPYLVVKTWSHNNQAAAIKLADKMAVEALRRPLEELHRMLERESFSGTTGTHEVEMHYRALT